MQSGAAKMTNVGGRPAGPIKCERCRKKSKSCGQLCANWPGPASPSVVQQAEVTAADVIAAVATASVPTRRVSARGKVPRRERDVDFPELRDRATGKRHHGGGGAEEVRRRGRRRRRRRRGRERLPRRRGCCFA